MIRLLPWTLMLLLMTFPCRAEEGETEQTTEDEAGTESAQDVEPLPGSSPDRPKTMSGMSILGNEEAPKALVIVPWKSSELGDELSLSENLDDRATPVDKEVFQRELEFYEIRKGE